LWKPCARILSRGQCFIARDLLVDALNVEQVENFLVLLENFLVLLVERCLIFGDPPVLCLQGLFCLVNLVFQALEVHLDPC
jgi:hypothetical protein